MAKTSKLSDEEQVAEYYTKLDHPLKDLVQALRQMVLAADKEIGEQVKWNSPSFFYTGAMKPFDPKEYKRDIVVFNLHKKDLVLLVFPTGAAINNKTGLLEGKFPDGRKVVKFNTMEQVKASEQNLQTVIKEWLKQVDR